MLSDEQLDQMEQMIYFAEPDEVMEVLSKLIPVLFAELRITRGTLNSKVNQFLGDVSDGSNGDAPANEAATQHSEEPLPEQSHEHTEDHEGDEPQPDGEASAGDPPAASGRKEKKRRVAKSKGNRATKKPNKRLVDTRTGKAEIRRRSSRKPQDAARESVQQDVGIEELPDLTGDD